MYQSKTFIATPPGATIREQLSLRGMKQKEFAIRMDLSEKHISRLITGQVELTQDVALRLESVLGIPAQFWNNLEAIYREKILRVKEENYLIEEIEQSRQFPYNEMIALGWIKETNNPIERVQNLRSFFEVARLQKLEDLGIPGISYRRVGFGKKTDYSLAVWSQKARLEARNDILSPINVEKLQASILKIRSMTLKEPHIFCQELKTIFSQCGIALVFLPHIKGSFLHGATFVDGNHVVMGLTVRGKTADKFWFSLFHEIQHIINGDIYNASFEDEEFEYKADCFARDVLIPMDKFTGFVENQKFDRISIEKFARDLGVSPGIVVGRLQKENMIQYNAFNDLKVSYTLDCGS